MTRITLGHHTRRLEDRVCDLSHRELLMVRLLRRDDRGIRRKHEVDTGVGHQVGLELGHIHVQGTIETKGGREGGDDLSDQTVEVGVGGALNVEVATADVVEGLIVKAEGTIRVLQKGMRGQHGVVRLNDSSGHLGRGGHREGELGLAPVVNREALEEEGSKTGSSTSSSSVEDKESLESGTVVSQLTDPV
mmetsp:Transcript_31564/g.66829  ORF Transcript_31564/g.66829 Transcript_31564/m.66829 type:complete len:191 (-) Transcript_31564:518-1090(-)